VVLHDELGQIDRHQNLCHNGEHKGNTLLQVARSDPDYVRRLALTAQRPQVRAAARELVVAIEANEQAAQRGRAKTRRVRADGR
jgi:hypothetical protein